MTPAERRCRDRKYSRDTGWQTLNREHPGIRQKLEALPHPKGRHGSAWDYVSWCIDQGHTRPALSFIERL